MKILITRSSQILTLLLLQTSLIHSQGLTMLKHLKGTRTINGVKVTVTQEGFVDSLYYCGDDTGPYFAGNDYSRSCCQTGSYIFTFSQPIKEVYLNISALSTSDSYDEEAQIFVNGVHYKLTNAGEDSGCEPMAIISEDGNLRPCNGCTGSGSDRIKIEGPITTLKVSCVINLGQPQGMVFGVYMGKPIENYDNTLVNYTATFGENASGRELLIESSQLEHAIISLKNKNGYTIPIHYRSIELNRIVIDASDLAKGEYLLEINLNDEIEKQKLFIN